MQKAKVLTGKASKVLLLVSYYCQAALVIALQFKEPNTGKRTSYEIVIDGVLIPAINKHH